MTVSDGVSPSPKGGGEGWSRLGAPLNPQLVKSTSDVLVQQAASSSAMTPGVVHDRDQ